MAETPVSCGDFSPVIHIHFFYILFDLHQQRTHLQFIISIDKDKNVPKRYGDRDGAKVECTASVIWTSVALDIGSTSQECGCQSVGCTNKEEYT